MDTLKRKLPLVPENLLKRRKLHEIRRAREARNKALEGTKQKKKGKSHKLKFKRAEEFVKKYREVENDEKRIDFQYKQILRGKHTIPSDAKLALVVRTKRMDLACVKVRKLLILLRLNKLNSGVFVEINDLTKQMLDIVGPYIVWGFPDLKTIRELIFKRGFARVEGRRTPLSDNTVVEETLGEQNIVCVEDIVHEIFTVGPNFKKANNFLWPFQFRPPSHGYTKSETKTIGDGKYGFRGYDINEFILKRN